VGSLLELVIQDIDVIYKVLLTTLCGSAHVWYHSLKHDSILHFHDLSSKLISRFSRSIPTKKSTIELFTVTQQKDKSTTSYLQSCNEEMLNVKRLLNLQLKKLWLIEYTTISFREHYTSSLTNLLNMKHIIKNYIRVEKARVTKHDHLCFHAPPPYHQSPMVTSRINIKGYIYDCLKFSELTTTLL
jgi:hypothetical protein